MRFSAHCSRFTYARVLGDKLDHDGWGGSARLTLEKNAVKAVILID